jgi:hypothetical protein
MATATFAEAIATLKQAIDLELQQLEVFTGSATKNVVGMQDSLITGVKGDGASAILSAAAGYRSTFSALLSPGSTQSILSTLLGDVIGSSTLDEPTPTSVGEGLWRLREYMAGAAAQTVLTRGMSFGSISVGGSNVGNGTINRMTKDKYNSTLEGSTAEAKTFTCIQDQGQTSKDEEVFEVRGQHLFDFCKEAGSGIQTSMRAISARDSATFVRNPSWSSFSGTPPTAGSEVVAATTTSFSGWTLSAAANFKASVDQAYRGFPGDGTPMSIRVLDNGNLYQTFDDNQRPTFNPEVPYYTQVAVYRESNCDGNLTVTLGSKSQTFAMSGLSNGAWNIVRLDLDRDLIYDRWRSDDAQLKFTLASRTTGTLYLDDVIFSPMAVLDGLYYMIVGGATPFMREDVFTFTDTESATRGVLQYWMTHRSQASGLLGYAFTLPSAGSPTIADP